MNISSAGRGEGYFRASFRVTSRLLAPDDEWSGELAANLLKGYIAAALYWLAAEAQSARALDPFCAKLENERGRVAGWPIVTRATRSRHCKGEEC